MRRVPLKSSALLSLLAATASLSAPRPHRLPQHRTPLTAAVSRTTLDDSLAAPPPPRRRTGRGRPPLVDSDLLRFLNAQRQPPGDSIVAAADRGERRRSSANVMGGGRTGLGPSDTLNGGATPFESSGDPAVGALERPLDAAEEGGAASAAADPSVQDAWLRQYQRGHVAALLAERAAAGTEAALQAGIIVEAVATTRLAQWRVRRFLQERNQAWDRNSSAGGGGGGGGSSTTSRREVDDGDSTRALSSHAGIQHNSMEQVIDVLLHYGLSAKDICEILIQSPGVAFMRPRPAGIGDGDGARDGESLQETLDRVFVGLLMGRSQPHELQLRKYDARKVLRNTPGLLSVQGAQSATAMVMLLTKLGVSASALSRDKNALPVLLSRDPKAVFRLVAFLASDAVRMPVDAIGSLLRRADGQALLDAVAPVSPPASRRRRGSGSSAVVAAQVRRAVVHDLYRRMSQTAWTLRNEIGTNDLGKVISAYPSVLLLDAARQILPTAHYLMHELDILPDDLPSVLQLYPALLRMDVEQMRNVVAYLTSLEVAADNFGSIFRSFPALLTLDVEHDMEPVVAYLRSIGISNVGRFVSRLPPVLGYSVEEELRPKFDFLASVSVDARFEVSKFPAFFSYPLERVIQARFEYLRDVKRIPTPLLSLDRVLCSGDRDFAVRMARDPDVANYAAFVAERRRQLALATGRTTRQPERRTVEAPPSPPAINNKKGTVAGLDATPPLLPPSAAAISS